MTNYSVFPAPYTVGPDAYRQIPGVCRLYGKKAVVIGGETAIRVSKQKMLAALEGSDLQIVDFIVYGKECTHDRADALAAMPQVQGADMLFAVGGGKAVDTCKLVSIKTGKPFFSFPTICSNCAASSAIAIVYNEDHSFCEFVYMTHETSHVFIDTQICAEAPREYLWAGIGDTYAKYYEVTISAKGEVLPHYLAMGVNICRMCWEPLKQFGAKALADNEKRTTSYEFEQCALAIIITTGYVSMFLTQEHSMEYNGGVAHAFFYGMCNMPGFDKTHLHGVVVGFGVLVALLIDGQPEEAACLAEYNKTVNLPVKLSDIGVTVEDVARYAESMTHDEDLEHYPYRVTAQMIVDAVKQLDV